MKVSIRLDVKRSIIFVKVSHDQARLQRDFADCLPEHWDDDLKMITARHPDFDNLYPELLELHVRIRKVNRSNLTDTGAAMATVMRSSENDNPDIVKWLDRYITDIERKITLASDTTERNRLNGHHYRYDSIRSKLIKFYDSITYDQITRQAVLDFREWMVEDPAISKNKTINDYLGKFRATYNKVLTDYDLDDRRPFRSVMLPKDVRSYNDTRKHLDDENLQRLMTVPLTGRMNMYRNVWGACFHLGGCDIGDLYFRSHADVSGCRIYFERSKVEGSSVDLWLSPHVRQLIREYRGTDEKLFNWPMGTYTQYKTWRRNGARALKKISENHGIKTAGGKHVGWKNVRHTFATRAKRRGVDGDLLRELMGHRRNDIDNIYKDLFPEHTRDAALIRVIGL